jgi:hypothetical protein
MPKPFNYKDKMGQHAANKFKSNDPLRDILDKIQNNGYDHNPYFPDHINNEPDRVKRNLMKAKYRTEQDK